MAYPDLIRGRPLTDEEKIFSALLEKYRRRDYYLSRQVTRRYGLPQAALGRSATAAIATAADHFGRGLASPTASSPRPKSEDRP